MEIKIKDVNELETLVLNLTFYDDNNKITVANSLSYIIVDVDSETVILTVNNFTVNAQTYVLVVPFAKNAIINPVSTGEDKIINIIFTYLNGTRQGTYDYKYRVRNLGIATPFQV